MNPSNQESVTDDTGDSSSAKNYKQESSTQETQNPPTQSTQGTSSGLGALSDLPPGFNKPKLSPPRLYLFDVDVTNSNSLVLPYELAARDLLPDDVNILAYREHTIEITDSDNNLWPKKLTCVSFEAEDALILTRGWSAYAAHLDIHPRDTIRFMIPDLRRGPNHFKILHYPRLESVPAFLPDNFLFQVDVAFGRLVIDSNHMRQHFPDICLGGEKEMVKITDYQGKDWFMMMVYSEPADQFMVIDSWEMFETQHVLGPRDRVRFYKPDFDTHNKHFLIQFIGQERMQKGTNLEQGSGGSKDKGKGIEQSGSRSEDKVKGVKR